ncbi:uncharacterized protein STEHIDRAFT_160485 [Stereum hirsutum FP-91666 SS1]|uniref:uncharacterized protein n=1 Tax=Stereum hirsutum (strain FP-91666) TaxID=721885 RepID=UPI000444A3A5|nr:uncharacterized protein STEHIDRAFT_160485 [Stereum hirsutum FP-91666 SS1]EIM82864.1 hypothetical protein STEHIDRAFT_160485 [Stereum hirsutum FP-91666 SS1]
MNFLTADGLAVSYPAWTFRGQSVHTDLLPGSSSAQDYQSKVMDWGWVTTPQPVIQGSAFHPSQRSFDDEHCFRMCFGTPHPVQPLPRAESTIWVTTDGDMQDDAEDDFNGHVVPSSLSLSRQLHRMRSSLPPDTVSAYANPVHHLSTNRGISQYLADMILGHLPLIDMSILRKANKFWYSVVRNFLRRKHRSVLREYVTDDIALRSVMRATRSVISGSEALDYCLHGTLNPSFTPTDLDIYTNCVYAILVVRHLMKHEGYEWIASADREDDNEEERVEEYGGAVTAFFWGTLVMNCLTADGFAMAYPTLTTIGRGLVSPINIPNLVIDECIAKYVGRGFDIDVFSRNVISADSITSGVDDGAPSITTLAKRHRKDTILWNCPNTYREWGDEGCLGMPFDSGPEKAPDWTNGGTGWVMGGHDCGGECDYNIRTCRRPDSHESSNMSTVSATDLSSRGALFSAYADTLLSGSVDDAFNYIRLVSNSGGSAPASYPFAVLDSRTAKPLTLTVRGVVQDFALGEEGDGGMHPSGFGGWELIAFTRLVPGYAAWYDQFRAQMRGIANIIEAIFLHLGLPPPANTIDLPTALVLRRRLLPGDFHPEVQVQACDGGLCAARDGDLDVGDLVDVSAWFDIAVMKGSDGIPRTAVFLAFDRVVRIRRQTEIEMMDRVGLFEPSLMASRFDYVYGENLGWTVFDYLNDIAATDEEALTIAREGNKNREGVLQSGDI